MEKNGTPKNFVVGFISIFLCFSYARAQAPNCNINLADCGIALESQDGPAGQSSMPPDHVIIGKYQSLTNYNGSIRIEDGFLVNSYDEKLSAIGPNGELLDVANGDPLSEAQAGIDGYVSSVAATTESIQEAVDECTSSAKWANMSCTATEFMPIIQALLPGFASTSQDSIAEACKKSADAGKMSAAISAAAVSACYLKRNTCDTTCSAITAAGASSGGYSQEQVESASTALTACRKLKFNEMMIGLSAMQALGAVQQANNCEEIAKDDSDMWKCSKPENMSDPEQCPDTACSVSYPQNRDHPACTSLVSNPANACPGPTCNMVCLQPQNQNHPSCIAYQNANPINGPGSGQGINAPGMSADLPTGLGLDGEEDAWFDKEFTGFDGEGAIPGELAQGGKNGGASLGGGGAGGGGSGSGGSGGGVGSGGYDTDIIGRASGGSAGGGGGGGFAGGYASAGGAWKKAGRAAGEGGSASQFDLSKFLPKKTASKRKAASVGPRELSGMGITKANGLSNFQKVTRMINKKRPELINK